MYTYAKIKMNVIELTGQHSCLKDVQGLERKRAL
jgi:hypothetical protein